MRIQDTSRIIHHPNHGQVEPEPELEVEPIPQDGIIHRMSDDYDLSNFGPRKRPLTTPCRCIANSREDRGGRVYFGNAIALSSTVFRILFKCKVCKQHYLYEKSSLRKYRYHVFQAKDYGKHKDRSGNVPKDRIQRGKV